MQTPLEGSSKSEEVNTYRPILKHLSSLLKLTILGKHVRELFRQIQIYKMIFTLNEIPADVDWLLVGRNQGIKNNGKVFLCFSFNFNFIFGG